MAEHIYTKGTPIWYEDKEHGWVAGEVAESVVDGKQVILTLSNERPQGKNVVVRATLNEVSDNSSKLPPLRNAGSFDFTDDLATLPHLNEPSILHVVEKRYAQHKIYTYSGIVLVAVNPFTEVPIYGPEVIQEYAGRTRENLEPHLFSIAEETYTAMRHTRRSQTVIISGESGAGKTESAKYIMRYLATVTPTSEGSESPTSSSTSVERQILATNPILEAFGNAKTTRNDNSSRFGKYIQILFDGGHTIVGARIRTYLLERARISYQQRGERNYHIFYQLCAGASAKERAALSLDRPASEFAYLASSASFDKDEAASFVATKRALSTVGIAAAQQMRIFKLLAGLLHLGDITIRQHRDNPDAIVDEKDPALVTAMDLLGIDLKEFRKWTTTKHFAARGENIRSNRPAGQARGVRDGVAKFIYSCLFDWLVAQVNSSLRSDGASYKEQTFIAVLDIYGFEHFETNSFEQFCINYANEKLQQQFTSHVFKIQQVEYASEDIDWQTIDFSDNQPTIDLIEGRLGLLAILDEESRLAAGTDATFIEKLNWQILNSGSPSTKSRNERIFKNTPDSFTIAHYAHSVEYDVDGFLEKNRGTVPDEHMDLLLASKNDFLREIVEASAVGKAANPPGSLSTPAPGSSASRPTTPTNRPVTPSNRPTTPSANRFRPMTPSSQAQVNVRGHVRNLTANTAGSPFPDRKAQTTSRKPTQCSIFKTSLRTLMDTLAQTDIHYIRCMKPNEGKEPWVLERGLVLDQLRACGVLETVRISTSGYPSRWSYEEFSQRYAVLLPKEEADVLLMKRDPKLTSVAVLTRFVLDSTKYRLGRTKVFFRVRVLAILEGLRHEVEVRAAITIQCAWRSVVARHELAWLREEKEEQERLEHERLEHERLEQERLEEERRQRERERHARDSDVMSSHYDVDALSLKLDVASLRDIPAIPDSPTLTSQLPPSPRSARTPQPPSPRSARTPRPSASGSGPPRTPMKKQTSAVSLGSAGKQLSSPPAFGYQQATQSSARKHVLIAEEREDRERGRENLRVDRTSDRGISTERVKSRATSRVGSRDPPRIPQERARSRDPENGRVKDKDRHHQSGNALTRLMGLSDGAEKGKRKEKERDGRETPLGKERPRMFGGRTWKLGRSAKGSTEPPRQEELQVEDEGPPVPPKAPAKEKEKDDAPLPIYAKFTSTQRSTPWYLEAQA